MIFLYADDLIQWSRGSASPIYAQVGFNAGDNENFFVIQGSQNASIVDIETTSNVGTPGKYVFRVDSIIITTPAAS